MRSVWRPGLQEQKGSPPSNVKGASVPASLLVVPAAPALVEPAEPEEPAEPPEPGRPARASCGSSRRRRALRACASQREKHTAESPAHRYRLLADTLSASSDCRRAVYSAGMPTLQERAAHFVASGYGVDVCSECGLVATAHEACLACKSPFPAARWAAPKNADGTFWVRVSPGFRCTECQRDSPLNHFDLDGQVACLQCQSSSQFEPRRWLVVVNEAHAVGDLRGPNPTWEAPGESYAQVGVSINGTGVFLGEVSVEACPGHPLCDSCRVPLRLTYRHTPVIELQCPLCQHPPRRFELPPGAAELFPALRGAVLRVPRGGQARCARRRRRWSPQAHLPRLWCRPDVSRWKRGDQLRLLPHAVPRGASRLGFGVWRARRGATVVALAQGPESSAARARLLCDTSAWNLQGHARFSIHSCSNPKPSGSTSAVPISRHGPRASWHVGARCHPQVQHGPTRGEVASSRPPAARLHE